VDLAENNTGTENIDLGPDIDADALSLELGTSEPIDIGPDIDADDEQVPQSLTYVAPIDLGPDLDADDPDSEQVIWDGQPNIDLGPDLDADALYDENYSTDAAIDLGDNIDLTEPC
jgi:hypothetical protein